MIRKSSHLLSGVPRLVRRHAALVSDMEKEIPDLCLGYGCCGTGRNCNPDSAGLPVFRLIMEGPGCGHGLLRLYRPFLRKEPALFPGSLRAAGSGCCPVLPDSQSVPL